ncbi:MAG: hypothetical protein KAI53_03435 [Candidatus Aenigmarchaeota archaeon]|nr:hypothetical protein [Candidatus Aenigmarchaeota archaeon]
METRKIQATGGGGTYIVSLPKNWIEKQKIKRKDLLNVFEREDGALIIIPNTQKSKITRTKTISIKEKNSQFTTRKIISAYINGADTIELTGTANWKQRKTLKESAKKMLIGVEITEDKNKMSIQCIIDVSKLSIKKILEKSYNTTNWMYAHAFTAFEEKNTELAEDIIERDSEVDQLVVLAIRQLNSAAMDPAFAELIDISGLDTLYYRAVIDYVEIMADCCVNIASATLKMQNTTIPKDMKEKIIAISKKVNKAYSDVVYAFKNKEIVLANNAIEDAEATEKEIFSAEGKSMILADKRLRDNPEIIGVVAIILENLGYILHLSRSVAELVIDRGINDKEN